MEERMGNKCAHVFVLILLGLGIACGEGEKKQEKLIRKVRYQQVFITGGKRTRAFSC